MSNAALFENRRRLRRARRVHDLDASQDFRFGLVRRNPVDERIKCLWQLPCRSGVEYHRDARVMCDLRSPRNRLLWSFKLHEKRSCVFDVLPERLYVPWRKRPVRPKRNGDHVLPFRVHKDERRARRLLLVDHETCGDALCLHSPCSVAPEEVVADFRDEIATSARKAGYDTLLGDVSVPDAEERGRWALAIARAYAARRIAGVLLEPVDLIPGSHEATKRVLDVLAAKNVPVVLIDRDYLPPPERSSYDLVGIDNFQAGYRLAKHLLDAGARKIRFLTQPDYATTIRGRISGVAQAVIDAGLPWRGNHVIETNPGDIAAFRRLMSGKNSPDAFVCRNDPLAAKLLQTLSALDIEVPKAVKVAGFDDAKMASLLNPPLTTIRQPVERIAQTAVESILQRIRNPALAPRSILLDTQMIVRRSTVCHCLATT